MLLLLHHVEHALYRTGRQIFAHVLCELDLVEDSAVVCRRDQSTLQVLPSHKILKALVEALVVDIKSFQEPRPGLLESEPRETGSVAYQHSGLHIVESQQCRYCPCSAQPGRIEDIKKLVSRNRTGRIELILIQAGENNLSIQYTKRMSGIHLAIPVFSKGYRPKQGKVAP